MAAVPPPEKSPVWERGEIPMTIGALEVDPLVLAPLGIGAALEHPATRSPAASRRLPTTLLRPLGHDPPSGCNRLQDSMQGPGACQSRCGVDSVDGRGGATRR